MPRPTKLGPHDPTDVGPYTLLARLGQGGQGKVYLAADNDGNQVAVKVLKVDWDDSGMWKRNLGRELVNARKVVQFVTARVLDFDIVGEPPYIVSEYIEGLTLAEHVHENGPLKDSELLQVASQTLTALEAIHQAGIIHCDFKPANIILGRGGARVIDFGIALALDSTHRVGEVAGTLPFMAPEQMSNNRLTAAVDLFAWGSTMVFAATGHYAFPGETREVLAQHILRNAPKLDGIGEPLLTIVQACLQKSPEHRPTAARARQMLLESRPASAPGSRAPVYAVGVASWREGGSVPPTTLVEQSSPLRTPPSTSPPSPQGRSVSGKSWKGLIPISAAAAVAVVLAVVWGGPGPSDGTSANDGPTQHSNSPVPAMQDPTRALADYVGYWPDVACSSAPAPSGLQTRLTCPISRAGVTMSLYCIRYDDMTAMAEQGRPGGRRNNISTGDIAWRNRWYRDDSRHGDFIAYRLVSGSAAIWWEDSASPVACFIHGPKGSDPTLLTVFLNHDFKLRDPVPSPVPSTQDPARALADYVGYWPDVACSSAPGLSGLQTKLTCPISRAGVTMSLYCIRYDDMTAMAEQGRPGGRRNNISTGDIAWRNRWYRDDSRHGDFIAYRLVSGSAAIWWEDSASPVACFIHGPKGSDPTLLTVFLNHDFKLRDPVPTPN